MVTLARVSDDTERAQLLEQVFERGLSTRQLVEAIRTPKTATKRPASVMHGLVKQAKSMEAALSQATPVLTPEAGTPEARAEAIGQFAGAVVAFGIALAALGDGARARAILEVLGEPGPRFERE